VQATAVTIGALLRINLLSVGIQLPRVARFQTPLACQCMLAQGDAAPDFELPDQHGNPVRLSDLGGKSVVLYFYPKADTPGCTVQACGVRDHSADYVAANAVVLGVSPDSVKKIAKFDDKFTLSFPLLSDEDHSVAEAYGVWVEKSMYGRTYMGMERSTFVIDPDGVIAQVFRKVKPVEHDALVLDALRG
jgi:peroxiredoxin Q/BCP